MSEVRDSYTVRPARAGDAEAITAMWADMAKLHESFHRECWEYAEDAHKSVHQHIVESVDDPEMIQLVACNPEGWPVGFARGCVRKANPIFRIRVSGEVWDLFVAAPHRGHGLGRRLLQKLMDEMKARGAEDVQLKASLLNECAIELYKKMGFEPVMQHMYKRI